MSFDAFLNADPDAVGGDNPDPPDPGFYEVALIDAGVFTAKSNGRLTLTMKWKVISAGPNTDHEWTSLQQIREGNQQSANFFKRACVDLGVNVDASRSVEDLNTNVIAKIGGYYTLEVVQNGQYRNTYIKGTTNGQAVAPDFAPPAPVPALTGSDDTPAEW